MDRGEPRHPRSEATSVTYPTTLPDASILVRNDQKRCNGAPVRQAPPRSEAHEATYKIWSGFHPGTGQSRSQRFCPSLPVGRTTRTLRQPAGPVKARTRDGRHRSAVHRAFFQEGIRSARPGAMSDRLSGPRPRLGTRAQTKNHPGRPCLRNLLFRFRHPPSAESSGPINGARICTRNPRAPPPSPGGARAAPRAPRA